MNATETLTVGTADRLRAVEVDLRAALSILARAGTDLCELASDPARGDLLCCDRVVLRIAAGSALSVARSLDRVRTNRELARLFARADEVAELADARLASEEAPF
jgi:hypothetical protein